jgi:hypothetical protein
MVIDPGGSLFHHFHGLLGPLTSRWRLRAQAGPEFLFQRANPSDQVTKISYVYAFGGDLCVIGGRSLTMNVGRPIPGGAYLIRVYTRVRDTWKIRVEVDKATAGP